MAITQEQKRQYLHDFLVSIGEMYLAEKKFISNVKRILAFVNPIQTFDYNQSIASFHPTQAQSETPQIHAQLLAILTKEELCMLFGTMEDILAHHVRVLLPGLEGIVALLPGEVQALIEMELRKNKLLADETPPPSNDFNLTTELARYLKIEIADQSNTGLTICYPEKANISPQAIELRSVHAALILNAIHKLTEHDYYLAFFLKDNQQEYCENIWRNQVAFQRFADAERTHKLEKLNALFHNQLNLSLTNEQHQIQQMPIVYTVFLRKLRAAIASYYEYNVSKNISKDQQLLPLVSGNNTTKPTDDKRLTRLYQCCNQANATISHLQDLFTTTDEGTTKLTKQQRNLLKRPPPSLQQAFKVTIAMLLTLPKQLTWQAACNWQLFKKSLPNNQVIFSDSAAQYVCYIQSSYGSNFIKIYKVQNQLLKLEIITENIRSKADLLEVSNLLISCITFLNPTSYTAVTLTCNSPNLCRNLCALAIDKNIKMFKLEANTKTKLQHYLMQHPGEIELAVKFKPPAIVTQVQTLLDAGFIPEPNEEIEEIEELLRLYSTSPENSTDKQISATRLQIHHNTALIAIKQILYCLNNGIMFALDKQTLNAVKIELAKNKSFTKASVMAQNHLDASACLTTILNLGMIPDFSSMETAELFQQQLDFAYNTYTTRTAHTAHTMHTSHAARTANNIICNSTSSFLIPDSSSNPELALKQWQALTQAGLPAKFSTVALEKKIMRLNITSKEQDKTIICSSIPQVTLTIINYALRLKLNIELEEHTRDHLSHYLAANLDESTDTAIAISSPVTIASPIAITSPIAIASPIAITSPSFDQFKFCLENGLLLRLTPTSIARIVKDIKQHKPDSLPDSLTVNFCRFPPQAFTLLKLLISQIETINQKINKPIKYYCDMLTKAHNSHAFYLQLEEQLTEFMNQHNNLLEEISEVKLFYSVPTAEVSAKAHAQVKVGAKAKAGTKVKASTSTKTKAGAEVKIGAGAEVKIGKAVTKKQWTVQQSEELSSEKTIAALQERLNNMRTNAKLTATVKLVILTELLREGCNTVYKEFFQQLLTKLAPLQRIIDGILYDISKSLLPIASKGEKQFHLHKNWYSSQHWQQQAQKIAQDLEKQMVKAVEQTHNVAHSSYFNLPPYNKSAQQAYQDVASKNPGAIPLISVADHNLIYNSTPLTEVQLAALSSFAAEKRISILQEKIGVGKSLGKSLGTSLDKLDHQDIQQLQIELNHLVKALEQPGSFSS